MSVPAQMPLVQIHNVNTVNIDSVPVPVCGADDVVVAVQHCGICGSDLGYIAMGGLLGPGNPMPLGHEMSAEVIEVGANVNTVSVGERVVVNPMEVDPPIGNMGPEGGFAPYLLVRDVATHPQAVLALPAHIDNRMAALVEPMSVAMHGVHRGEVSAEDKVVVFGAGTIGLCITTVLLHYGVSDIVVVDTVQARLDKASTLGAHTMLAGEDDLAAGLKQHHGSVQSYGMPIPATDVYLEATGVGAVFEQMVSLAKTNARLVVVGVHKAPASIDLVSVLSKELSITGAMAYPEEFPAVIDMLSALLADQNSKAALTPELIITHDYPLSQFHEALAMARDADRAIKVMINCQQ